MAFRTHAKVIWHGVLDSVNGGIVFGPGGMAEMIAGTGRRERSRIGRGGSRTGSRWLSAIAAVALLWCNGARAAETRAILLRGYLGLFSGGLDKLADELRAKGINAEVRKHLYWTTAVTDILRERAAGRVDRLILIGHSQGGNDAIEIARALEISHVPVDLLVTFAPYGQKPVPANVARAINYYQHGGWGWPLIPEPGFPGKLVNFDLAGDPSIFHFNIDNSSRIHAEVLREIDALPQANAPAKAQANGRRK
jgi:pimeloyl-ACP methyl ester carboxylesterase